MKSAADKVQDSAKGAARGVEKETDNARKQVKDSL